MNINYLQVVIAAAIPAIFYYVAVFSSVRFEAERLNLPPVPPSQIPPARDIIKWSRIAPLASSMGILFFLMGTGYSVTYSAFMACVVLLAFFFFFAKFSLADKKDQFFSFLRSLEDAAYGMIHIVSLVVCANIIIILINKSGLGVKLSELILGLAKENLLASLMLTACISLILGMGMPTAAAYVLTAAVCASALVKLNILPIAAHLFFFYFATISAITPPVCIAVYTAATISRANWMRIARVALRLGIVSFICPFIFVYNNELLMIGVWWRILQAFLTGTTGVIFLSAAVMGYFIRRPVPMIVRTLWFLGGILLIDPGLVTDLIGFGLIGAGLVIVFLVRPGFGSAKLTEKIEKES